MKKSILVIGMGRVGVHLAENMQKLGNDVVIVDNKPEVIEKMSSKFTDAIIGDCTNEDVLESIGVADFDVCFVMIAENFQSSLEVTSLLKEHGAKKVVSKANTKIQQKFLKRNGADVVIYPEYDAAKRLADRFNMDNVFDCIELNEEYAIYEILVPKKWIGKNLEEIGVRKTHQINVLMTKNNGELNPLPGGAYVFREDDHLIALGKAEDIA